MSSSTWKVVPCEFSDLDECLDLYNEAFASDKNFLYFHPRSDPKVVRAGALERHQKSFGNDWVKYFKVVDEETGKIAAFSKWEYPHPAPPNAEETLKAILAAPQPPGSNDDVVLDFLTQLFGGRQKWIVPETFYFMNILAVHPAYQRRGLGSLLLAPVLELADRENAKIYIEASDTGLGLYKKHGWVEVGEIVVDYSKYGGPKAQTSKQMIREPVSSNGKP